MASPFCICGLDSRSEIKSYKTRVNDRNHTKFKKLDEDCPLLAFPDDCLRHMHNHGLDTVFCMEGVAADGTAGKELFNHHTRHSQETVLQHLVQDVTENWITRATVVGVQKTLQECEERCQKVHQMWGNEN